MKKIEVETKRVSMEKERVSYKEKMVLSVKEVTSGLVGGRDGIKSSFITALAINLGVMIAAVILILLSATRDLGYTLLSNLFLLQIGAGMITIMMSAFFTLIKDVKRAGQALRVGTILVVLNLIASLLVN